MSSVCGRRRRRPPFTYPMLVVHLTAAPRAGEEVRFSRRLPGSPGRALSWEVLRWRIRASSSCRDHGSPPRRETQSSAAGWAGGYSVRTTESSVDRPSPTPTQKPPSRQSTGSGLSQRPAMHTSFMIPHPGTGPGILKTKVLGSPTPAAVSGMSANADTTLSSSVPRRRARLRPSRTIWSISPGNEVCHWRARRRSRREQRSPANPGRPLLAAIRRRSMVVLGRRPLGDRADMGTAVRRRQRVKYRRADRSYSPGRAACWCARPVIS